MGINVVFSQPMILLIYLWSFHNQGLVGWMFRFALCSDIDGDFWGDIDF
jgi:hypothetical protein